MVTQAVILAGGKGTRLGALAQQRPKALVDIAGTPLLVRQLEVLRRHGVTNVVILTGHLGDVLEAEVGDGSARGLSITYRREAAPLGTAGSLRAAEDLLAEDFFVVYGDIIFDIDLNRVAGFHRRKGTVATLVVHPNDHPYDSDVVEVDAQDRVVAFHTKTREPGRLVPNLVNAGIYLCSRRTLDFVRPDQFADFGLDIFPDMVATGEHLAAYNTPEYAKDAGTPGRHEAVSADVRSGKVMRRNIANPQRAVFIDRDGVIIEERGDAVRANDVRLLPGVAEAVAALNRSDYLALVITNQPGIAKGFITEADVADTHKAIDMALGEARAYVHGYEVCPHHPQRGFPGEIEALKVECDCRKPRPGMLLRAAERFNIDLAQSFMIGDRSVDIAAGHAAGTGTIGVRTGYGCTDAITADQPDRMADDLMAAVNQILSRAG